MILVDILCQIEKWGQQQIAALSKVAVSIPPELSFGELSYIRV